MKGGRTRVQIAGLVLAAGIGLAACTGDTGEPTPTSEPTSSTIESAPVTQPPPADDDEQTSIAEPELSGEAQDKADVEATLRSYMNALGQARTGESPIEDIYPYSRDTAREQWVTQLMAYEAQGITIEGAVELQVVEITVDGDSATVVACADVSDTDAFDESGESIVPEDRPEQTLNDFVLERDSSAEIGWYVIEDANRDEPCDG